MSTTEHKKYCPSNGTEGADFIDAWCRKCVRDQGDIEAGEPGCEILFTTMVLDVDHPDYPSEWTFDRFGRPICTAFDSIEEAHAATETQRISLVDDKTEDLFNSRGAM
jgi:hypothetical protein